MVKVLSLDLKSKMTNEKISLITKDSEIFSTQKNFKEIFCVLEMQSISMSLVKHEKNSKRIFLCPKIIFYGFHFVQTL